MPFEGGFFFWRSSWYVLDEAISILPWIGWLGPFLSWPWSRIRGAREWIEQKQEERAGRPHAWEHIPFCRKWSVTNSLPILLREHMTIVQLYEEKAWRQSLNKKRKTIVDQLTIYLFIPKWSKPKASTLDSINKKKRKKTMSLMVFEPSNTLFFVDLVV